MRFFLLASLLVASCFSKKHMRTHSVDQSMQERSVGTPPATDGSAQCGSLQVPENTLHDAAMQGNNRAYHRAGEAEAVQLKMCAKESDHSGCNALMQIPPGMMVIEPKKMRKSEENDWIHYVSCEKGTPNCAMMEVQEGMLVDLKHKGRMYKAGRSGPSFVYFEFCP